MPQLQPVVLNDGTADRTFSPRDIKQNVATSVFRPGVAVGDAITLTRSLVGNDKTGYKPMLKLVVPVTENIGGVQTVVDENIYNISGRISPRSEAALLTMGLSLVQALLAHADTQAMLVNRESVY